MREAGNEGKGGCWTGWERGGLERERGTGKAVRREREVREGRRRSPVRELCGGRGPEGRGLEAEGWAGRWDGGGEPESS